MTTSPDRIDRIYHITAQADWDAAQRQGRYEAPSLQTQGFIHFSTVDQVLRVVNAIYTGQTGLILLEVDTARLESELKYEPPDMAVPAEHQTDELFPHLYGPLNVDAVVRVHDFPMGEDGHFTLPDGVR